MKKTGEQWIPTDTTPEEALINLERYYFALKHCEDRVVLDAGCGCGLGTYLYSLVAKRVIAVDHNDEAQEYAKQFPFDKHKVQFIKADLEKDVLPDHELTVALEVIEHLEKPDFFLSQLKGNELIFSLPLNSLAVSKFHKLDIKGEEEIRELIERYYKIEQYVNQYNHWLYGKATKI